MINKNLVIQRFAKATASYNRAANVQRQIACKMTNLLRGYLSPIHCDSLLEIGCGSGLFSRMLLPVFLPQKAVLNDICAGVEELLTDLLTDNVRFIAADAEAYPFPGKQDLIASCSTLQWFTDPDNFFKRCHTLLHANGYLAFTTFGKNNFKEITATTGNSLLYRSKEELCSSLFANYDIVYVDEEIISLEFETPMDVLYHLKDTGVTGIRPYVWTRNKLYSFSQQYTEVFGNGKTVPLTYHPIYIIAKKKFQ